MTARVVSLVTAVLAALALIFLLVSLPEQAQAVVWQDKVDPWVLQTVASATSTGSATDTSTGSVTDTSTGSVTETEFLLYLTEQADLSGADALPSKAEKGRYVYEQLTAVAAQSQPTLLKELERLGVAYKPFWIANMVWVRGDEAALAQLARRQDVAHVYANPAVKAAQPETSPL
ncbi:MAG: hypothetical protein IAF02_26525, partial [Anaerolineae bacterium]|nr:hypothetical protein [Anaerolineae bacterium]